VDVRCGILPVNKGSSEPADMPIWFVSIAFPLSTLEYLLYPKIGEGEGLSAVLS
jgi:hypothetical protein